MLVHKYHCLLFVAASTSSGGGGGNSVCPRETPAWQKPISTFFTKNEASNPKITDDIETVKTDKIEESNNQVDKKIKVSKNNDEEKENEQSSSNAKDKPKRKRLIISDDEDDD